MVHEIGHMFGLKHCTYYECLMNGIMSASEARQGGTRIFCPICVKKLKANLKFDTAERYKKLIQVSKELGFDTEAKIYQGLLEAGEAAPKYTFTEKELKSKIIPSNLLPKVVTSANTAQSRSPIRKTNAPVAKAGKGAAALQPKMNMAVTKQEVKTAAFSYKDLENM